MFRRVFAVLAMSFPAWLPGATPAGASAELAEGQTFPNIVLPSLDGSDALSIEDFRGRKIALHVFASW